VRVGPQSTILHTMNIRRRKVVLGQYAWEALKTVMKGVDVHATLFNNPANHARGRPFRLKYFRHVCAAPLVYNRFILVWGMFPHHDQVPLYFSRQLYYKF
jgi:hypothetical protein